MIKVDNHAVDHYPAVEVMDLKDNEWGFIENTGMDDVFILDDPKVNPVQGFKIRPREMYSYGPKEKGREFKVYAVSNRPCQGVKTTIVDLPTRRVR